MATLTRVTTSVLLATLLLTTSVGAKPDPLSAIRPLEMKQDDGSWMVVCTAFAVAAPHPGTWLTAGHCYDEKGEYRIDGVATRFEKAIVVRAFDGALLAGGPKVDQPLMLGFSTGAPLTPVYAAGYPHGSNALHVVAGIVGGGIEASDEYARQLFNIPVMGGMSGAPVIDTKSGVVVGLVVQTECSNVPFLTWCPFSLGTPISMLHDFVWGSTEPIR